MVWQKIDDQFGVSKKVIRIPRARRQQCVGLWLLALNYAGRALTDGLLEEHELDELGAKAGDIAELVRVGLWHAIDHDCPRCSQPASGAVIVHDFLVYNPSRAKVESDREAERVRKVSQRDKRRTATGTPAGVRHVSEHPGPGPYPTINNHQDLLGGGTKKSPWCTRHPGGTDEACGPCRTARLAFEAVETAERTRPTPAPPRGPTDPATCRHKFVAGWCARCEIQDTSVAS